MMKPLTTLFDETSAGGSLHLPADLAALYDGDLIIPAGSGDRPHCIANFVTSLDGIISYNLPGDDTGNAISGGSAIDHVVMGILRASADAVLWGSRNYAVARRFVPSPATIAPEYAESYRVLRKRLGKSDDAPLAVILTNSGDIPLDGAILTDPDQRALIITTATGYARLSGLQHAHPQVAVRSVTTGSDVAPGDALRLLRDEFGVATALHEGGPIVFAAFLAAGRIDELFLTIAPQFVGRTAAMPRPGLVEGTAFLPTTAPWAELVSLKRGDGYLFTRYRVVGPR